MGAPPGTDSVGAAGSEQVDCPLERKDAGADLREPQPPANVTSTNHRMRP